MPWKRGKNRHSANSDYSRKPYRPDGVTSWEHWNVWADRNGILGRNGRPSRSKVRTMVKRGELCGKVTKCAPETLHRYDPITGDPIFRRQRRYVVTHYLPEHATRTPEDWQQISEAIFRNSQANKGKKRHRKSKRLKSYPS